ncbi:MAG: hypothetical protein R3C44_03515 [Chloroflexota bacterium]
MEAVTGQTYEEAMQELVLDPLGLENTFFSMPMTLSRAGLWSATG